jgi:hypothetical protein
MTSGLPTYRLNQTLFLLEFKKGRKQSKGHNTQKELMGAKTKKPPRLIPLPLKSQSKMHPPPLAIIKLRISSNINCVLVSVFLDLFKESLNASSNDI